MKHIELFNDGFDSTVQEKIQPENWPYIGHDMITGEIVYTLVPEPDTVNYFYIESLEDNNIITLDSTTWAGYGNNKSKLEYSNDTTSWASMSGVDSITINNRERLYMRCIEGNICKDINSIPEEEAEIVVYTPLFKTSTNCNIGGNINSVMFDYTYNTEDCVLSAFAFACLFIGTEESANYIIDASKLELPTTTLADYCYYYMFGYCPSLTTAPKLPATELAEYCYADMFEECLSLTTAPELPATTLARECYENMFYNCTSLIAAPELPATTLADYCYQYMFGGCTSLVTTPELPATKLADDCYSGMFCGCKSLTTAPKILPATPLAEGCYSGMFAGCTSLTTAPELPATTLAESCYRYMFEGCSNLNYVKCLATDISATGCTFSWVEGVSSTGTFIKHPAMNDWSTSRDGILEGWTVVDADI